MSRFQFSSSEGEVFELDLSMLQLSTTLKTMLDDLGCEGAEEVVPLPKVDSETLGLIVTWMKHHANGNSAEAEENNRVDELDDYVVHSCEDVNQWDKRFLEDLDTPILFKVAMASNYLDIKKLLVSTCKLIASKIKEKEPAEIKKFLNIPQAKSEADQSLKRKR